MLASSENYTSHILDAKLAKKFRQFTNISKFTKDKILETVLICFYIEN